MSTFTSSLDYTPTDDGLYRINTPVRFYLDDMMSGNYVEIEQGMVTNFASIPKAVQFIFPHNHEDYRMAAAFHDGMVNEFGYQAKIKRHDAIMRTPTWQESAYWFREMMRVRQFNTRRKLSFAIRFPIMILDFFTRWAFWSSISLYGLVR